MGGFPLDQRFGLNAGFDVYDDRIGETGSTVDFALPERRADAVVIVRARLDRHAARQVVRLGARVRSARAVPGRRDEFARAIPADPYAGEVAWTDYALGPLFDRLSQPPVARRSSSSPPTTARASATTAS